MALRGRRAVFDALEISLETMTALTEPLAVIRAEDSDLFRQLRRAARSVPLNIAEGARRSGLDRKHHWRIAAGSADEVRTGLRVAVACAELDADVAAASMTLLDRVIAMLWRMTH